MTSKFFPNLFEDYSETAAKGLICNKKVDPNCKFLEQMEVKYQETVNEFTNLDSYDYSVYTGTSGIALLKLKKHPKNKDNLEEVLRLLKLKHLRYKRHTFLCGDVGPLAIGAVVYDKLNRKKEREEVLERLEAIKKDVLNTSLDLANEYLYGRAGYLFAVLYVNKNIQPSPFEDSFIRQIIEAIFFCGQREAKAGKFKCPLMYQWHDSFYLGAAHGISGILYLLLQVKEYLTEHELNDLIKPTIDYLITLKFPSGNYPSSVGQDKADKYVQWCHGAPGFLYLFTSAYRVFKETKYLDLAEECGNVIWERGLLRKGYSICHGVAGNGYCFLELFQTTQEDKHLYRALKFAEYCLNYKRKLEEYPPDTPLSLYEGKSGVLYFLLDLKEPLEAKFPGFTL